MTEPKYKTSLELNQEEYNKKEELKKKGVSIMAIFRNGLENLYKKILDKQGKV